MESDHGAKSCPRTRRAYFTLPGVGNGHSMSRWLDWLVRLDSSPVWPEHKTAKIPPVPGSFAGNPFPHAQLKVTNHSRAKGARPLLPNLAPPLQPPPTNQELAHGFP